MDAVSALLEERARSPQGLRRTVAISTAVHVVLVVLVIVVPKPVREPEDRLIMQISLGGAPGPQSGGMTAMGGRAVEAAPPEEAPKPAPALPPASRVPEMVLPKPTPAKPPPPRKAPDDARGRTAPKAETAQAGNTPVDTGARGVGFGLTTGGGGTGGYLDVQNFCCPEYLGTMVQLIQRNWNARQQVAGETLMKFTIQRDGRLTNIELERSSGYVALDLTAQRALAVTNRLPPLPAQFTEPNLTVHLIFRYER